MHIRLGQPQKILKQKFQIMKRSDLKTNIKNYLLKQQGLPNTMSSWGGLPPPVRGDHEQVMRGDR